jgi:hypothetical protein
MTVQSYKLGPGTLKFGAGLATDASCQVVSCEVVAAENVTTGDDVDLLCGEQLLGDETVTFTWTLNANLVQDIAAAGVVAWSWTNKGTEQGFEFIPNTVSARKVTGTINVVPIRIGGDAKKKNTSDISWRGKRGVDFVLANTP